MNFHPYTKLEYLHHLKMKLNMDYLIKYKNYLIILNILMVNIIKMVMLNFIIL